MKKRYSLLSAIIILSLLLGLLPSVFAEGISETQDLQDAQSEDKAPDNNEVLDEEEHWYLLSEAYYYSGELRSETEMDYNPDGSITERRKHEFRPDGTETRLAETYHFDENSRITGSETQDQDTGEIVEYSVWSFYDNGRLRQILHFKDEETLQYEQKNSYLEDGSTIKIIWYDDNGEVESRSVIWYDVDDNNYKYESFDENGKRVYIRETVFSKDGKKENGYEKGYGSKSIQKYVYDEDGMLLECISTQQDGYFAGCVTRTLYSYDEHGNQTEELTLSEGDVLSRYVRTWGRSGAVDSNTLNGWNETGEEIG